MKKENFERTVNETENPNVIRVTESYEIPRYSGKIYGDCDWYCEDIVSGLKNDCKIWTRKGKDFGSLCNIWESDYELYDFLTGNLEQDLEIFQKKLDRKFGKGKFEAFVLGAYIHSGTSFSINKVGNRVCRWDSSQLGFIGIPKNGDGDYGYKAEDASVIADELTDAWEGGFLNYQVVDEFTGDAVDENIFGTASGCLREENEWKEKTEQKYGIKWDSVDVIY